MGATFRLQIAFRFASKKVCDALLARLPEHILLRDLPAAARDDGELHATSTDATSFAHADEALQSLKPLAKKALVGHADLHCLDLDETVRLRAGLEEVVIRADPPPRSAEHAWQRVAHPEAIASLALRGSLLAVGGWAQSKPRGAAEGARAWGASVTVWDFETGLRRARLAECIDSISALAFAPDGELLAVGTGGGRVQIWNPLQAILVAQARVPGGAVYGLDWSPDRAHLLARTTQTTVLDARCKRLASLPEGTHDAIWALPDRVLMSSFGPKKGPQLWLWELGGAAARPLPTPPGHDPLRLALSRDGKRVCCACRHEVLIVDVTSLASAELAASRIPKPGGPWPPLSIGASARGWLGICRSGLIAVSDQGVLRDIAPGLPIECAVVSEQGDCCWCAPDRKASDQTLVRVNIVNG